YPGRVCPIATHRRRPRKRDAVEAVAGEGGITSVRLRDHAPKRSRRLIKAVPARAYKFPFPKQKRQTEIPASHAVFQFVSCIMILKCKQRVSMVFLFFPLPVPPMRLSMQTSSVKPAKNKSVQACHLLQACKMVFISKFGQRISAWQTIRPPSQKYYLPFS
ncbi:MAG: hypothetical protein IJ858_10120, partial [Acidaminococcaceae bacterium]|nr:hypothetical protein [Acidaminococcaceae bacterium]